MEKKINATLEIFHVKCTDIITTSGDHDNGYFDEGDLASILKKILPN